MGVNKDNNSNKEQDQLGKKKYLDGKLRIVEGIDGPTPKKDRLSQGNQKTIKSIKGEEKISHYQVQGEEDRIDANGRGRNGHSYFGWV